MIIQIIKLKSNLPEAELLEIANERKPRFEAIPGLIQKYYANFKDSGQYAGIYIWESREALEEFRKSELAAGIPKAYQLIEAPEVEIADLMFYLREM